MQRHVINAETGEIETVTLTETEIAAMPQMSPLSLVPPSVTRLQAKAALLQAGRLAQVEGLIANSDPMVQLAWNEASEFQRDSPTIATLAALVGMSQTEIDNLFIAAATIKF